MRRFTIDCSESLNSPGAARAFSLLPQLPAESLLLLDGLGTGADLPFVPVAVRPFGVDLVEAMLQQGRAAQHHAAPLAIMNAERLGFADEACDVAVLSLLLSVVEDGASAFAEAVRVTRRGGYVLVFDKFARAASKPSRVRRLLNRAIG